MFVYPPPLQTRSHISKAHFLSKLLVSRERADNGIYTILMYWVVFNVQKRIWLFYCRPFYLLKNLVVLKSFNVRIQNVLTGDLYPTWQGIIDTLWYIGFQWIWYKAYIQDLVYLYSISLKCICNSNLYE